LEYAKQYQIKNRAKRLEYNKQYYLENKEQAKQYHIKNRTKILEKQRSRSKEPDTIQKRKDYYQKNKEALKAKSKQYRIKNKEQILKKQKFYRQHNKKEIFATYKNLKIKINGRNVNRYVLDANNVITGIKYKNKIYNPNDFYIYNNRFCSLKTNIILDDNKNIKISLKQKIKNFFNKIIK